MPEELYEQATAAPNEKRQLADVPADQCLRHSIVALDEEGIILLCLYCDAKWSRINL